MRKFHKDPQYKFVQDGEFFYSEKFPPYPLYLPDEDIQLNGKGKKGRCAICGWLKPDRRIFVYHGYVETHYHVHSKCLKGWQKNRDIVPHSIDTRDMPVWRKHGRLRRRYYIAKSLMEKLGQTSLRVV